MLWKSHQNNKNTSVSNVPAHVILSPNDNSNLLNFMNFDNVGLSTVKDSTAFKKIQFFSKVNPSPLFNLKSDFENNFLKINNFFKNDTELSTSSNYGMLRQHNYLSSSFFLTFLDEKSSNKFFNYSLGQNTSPFYSKNILSLSRFNYSNSSSFSTESDINSYFKLMPSFFNKLGLFNFSFFLNYPNFLSTLSSETDSKHFSNNFKYLLNYKLKRKSIWDLQWSLNNSNYSDMSNLDSFNNFSGFSYNTDNLLKFKDLKSSNAQFLGSERTVRLLTNLNSNSYKSNLLSFSNYVSSFESKTSLYGQFQNNMYSFSKLNWPDYDKHTRFFNNTVHMPTSHSPVMSNNPFFSNTSFDFYEKNTDDLTPMVLRSKEESAPSHVFSTYWSSY
jgi:hypothetical protein